MNALIFLAPGFEEIEAVTVIDILRRADIIIRMVSITNNRTVTGAHDIEITADTTISNVKNTINDILILPGGMPGSTNLAENEELASIIKLHYEKGKWLAAICAAPLVYGRMGLLEDEKATCYPSFEPELAGAMISENTVVKSGQFITGKGPGVTMDFALKIIEELKGKATAEQIAHDLIK